MKNIITILFSCLVTVACSTKTQNAVNHNFVSNHIDSLADNKTLVVEFWDQSCAPCLKLKKDIFENVNHADFLKDNFVLIQISSKDSIYTSLCNHYNLQTQSTVLFFDKAGNEIERSAGYNGNKESYLKYLNDIVTRKNLFYHIYSDYINDSTNINLNHLLARKYLFRYENQKAIKLFHFILQNDSSDVFGYNTEATFRIAEYNFLKTGNIEDLKSFVNEYTNNEFLPEAYHYLIDYYKNENNQKNSLLTSGEAVRKFPYNPDLLNKHAWNIYLFKVEEDYSDAIELIEKAIEINPTVARYWDTQAWLFSEVGESAKAIQSEKKAVELFPHPEYKKALQNFKTI